MGSINDIFILLLKFFLYYFFFCLNPLRDCAHSYLPQLLSQVGDDKKTDFFLHLYRTVYLRDIYERNGIDLKQEFEELSKTIASSIGAPVSARKIANTFKSVAKVQNIADKTVALYMGYMQDAFLIEKSERYDIKGRKYIGSLSKYYYQDVGLRNAILSFRQNEVTHIMENVIYNEMRMRGWLVDVGNIFNRVRNTEGQQQRITLEVDFVCNKGSKRIYIQSAGCRKDGARKTFTQIGR